LEPTKSVLEGTLRSFLAEDLGLGDITTDSLIDPSIQGLATIVCNEQATIAGLWEALALLQISGCEGTALVKEGSRVTRGTQILKARGPASSLLKTERTLLNLLSHMSGVATITSELVQLARRAGGKDVRIACTRKTLPGLRYFEKRAVAIGGGDTHRFRLDDAVLIKDNHLSIIGTAAECVRKTRERVSFTKKIEIEATNSRQAIEAAREGADIILLDNMTPEAVKTTMAELREGGLRDKIIVEASGGITRENLSSYAKTGVDVISIGMLTHSARSVDLSMNITGSKRRRK
jgi:nicotinate-nucleotide pyrophosphorylase (carboxylating)